MLPTADDVKAEKTHQGLIEGVENFSSEKLKSVKTREPASGKDGEQKVKSNLLVIFNPESMRDFSNDDLQWRRATLRSRSPWTSWPSSTRVS